VARINQIHPLPWFQHRDRRLAMGWYEFVAVFEAEDDDEAADNIGGVTDA
jgi:hypothetical protein